MRKLLDYRGFTMIELMVTVGIFALLTSVVLASFRSGERSDALRLAGEQLVQDIRRTQHMVLTGETSLYQDVGQIAVQEQFPRGGYGMNFDRTTPSRYTLFAVGGDGNPLTPPRTIFSLPRDIIIKDVVLDGVATDELFLTFRPPQAQVFMQTVLQGFPSDAVNIALILTHTATKQERRIVLNRISGRVQME